MPINFHEGFSVYHGASTTSAAVNPQFHAKPVKPILDHRGEPLFRGWSYPAHVQEPTHVFDVHGTAVPRPPQGTPDSRLDLRDVYATQPLNKKLAARMEREARIVLLEKEVLA